MKKLCFSLLLLALLAVLGAVPGERYAREGLDLFQRGEYQQALNKFLAADRSANGTVADYHYWLGKLYLAVEDSVNARIRMQRCQQAGESRYLEEAREIERILTRQRSIFSKAKLRPMPDHFNSPNSDYGAVVSPDGEYLYFTSMRPAKKAKENIWRAEIFRTGYGRPELVENLSTDKNESLGSFGEAGNLAWIVGNFEKNKIDGDIYSVDLRDRQAVPVNASQFNSSQVETHPMSFRDNLMFFASSRPGGYGGMDIYVCEKIGGQWTEPINLGPVINTSANEQTPFLDFDGKTLYFASNGHAGFGGYDIFRAYRLGAGWQDWSVPDNLGMPFNSVNNDRYFYRIPLSNEAYISSDRKLSDFENIYHLTLEYALPASYLVKDAKSGLREVEIAPIQAGTKPKAESVSLWEKLNQGLEVLDTGLRLTEPKVDLQRPPAEGSDENVLPPVESYTGALELMPATIQIDGLVQDEQGNPLPADIELVYTLEGESVKELVSADAEGRFTFQAPIASTFNLYANLDGYLSHGEEFTPTGQEESIQARLVLKKLISDAPVSLNPILFQYESSLLDAKQQLMLDELIVAMLENPRLKLLIKGYANDGGSKTYNQELSEKRAAVVAEYLISKGLSAECVTTEAYGNSKFSGAAEAIDRRVDLELYR